MIIFELDGAISNSEHRQHFLQQQPRDFVSFYNSAYKDTLNKTTARILMFFLKNEEVELWTSRFENTRESVQDWLRQHDIFVHNEQLKMRPAFNQTKWVDLQEMWIEQYFKDGKKIDLAVVERKSVCTMWRSKGIECLQAMPGNF
jgi:hypothetical protein